MTSATNNGNGKTFQCPVCDEFNHTTTAFCHKCGLDFSVIDPEALADTGPAQPVKTKPPGAPLDPRPRPALAQQCPRCGELNRPGVILCEACGANLSTGERTSLSTRIISQNPGDGSALDVPISGAETLDVRAFHKTSRAGTSVFEHDMLLRIQVEGSNPPLLLRLTQGHPLTFGRRDGSVGHVDVDMSPYDAYAHGMSRRHAALELVNKRLEIWDLSSSNGTYLNGTKLDPEQRHQLRDGDEVRFGQMVIRMFFQQKVSR